MPLTEAQKKAKKKYDSNYRRIVLRINRKLEKDLLDYVESKESIQGYILDLIRKDFSKNK